MLFNRETYVFVQNMKFQEFYKKYKDKYHEKVDLFLTDPPFNVLQNSRDRINQSDMELLTQMAESFLVKGGTLLLFCSLDQLHLYRQYLERTTLTVETLVLNVINEEKCKFIINI